MKICVAQTRSVKGDILKNIENHKKLIELAASERAAFIVFPELSLTGYEPTLAKVLATRPEDSRFDDFQTMSNNRQITIGVGVPILSDTGINISMILFQPQQPRRTYAKKYIHADEEPYFVSGSNFTSLTVHHTQLALAICYELSVPAHAEDASASGVALYVASVAKSVGGIDKALQRLSDIARQYHMSVLMANCIGEADGEVCAGKTSIWNSQGLLLGQLNDTQEGILLFDTNTQEVLEKRI